MIPPLRACRLSIVRRAGERPGLRWIEGGAKKTSDATEIPRSYPGPSGPWGRVACDGTPRGEPRDSRRVLTLASKAGHRGDTRPFGDPPPSCALSGIPLPADPGSVRHTTHGDRSSNRQLEATTRDEDRQGLEAKANPRRIPPLAWASDDGNLSFLGLRYALYYWPSRYNQTVRSICSSKGYNGKKRDS